MKDAASHEPGLLDFVKAAFFARTRIAGLGLVPLNVLFVVGVGIIGIAVPGIALIGAGLELGWLAFLSQNPRFQAIVRGQRLLLREASFAARLRLITEHLPLAERTRWENLRRKCDAIRDLSGGFQPRGAVQAGVVQSSGLTSLLLIHANLLGSRVALEQHATDARASDIAAKLAGAEARLATAEGEGIRRSLEANVEILKKRQQHQQKARQSIEGIDVDLERIENQVDLIREESTGARDPDVLSARIDAVAATVGDVNRLLADSRDLLGDLQGPVDSSAPPERERLSEGTRT